MTRGWSVALALLLGASCTKSNPAATCADGTCSDPAFPFCDVDGAFGGAPGTCIAITCAAGSIGGCEGSDELVCDGTGTNYDATPCANGCDVTAGCVECAPNQTLCTSDGNLQSCDASGSATTQTCALGCGSGSALHCNELVPSNGLQTYVDMVPNPIDISLAGGTLDLDTGVFTPTTGNATTVPSFHMAAPAGGVDVTVFVGHDITLGQIVIQSADSADVFDGGVGPAVAFVATGTLNVSGRVALLSGAINLAGCNGTSGVATGSGQSNGGGGGNATDGADGGGILSKVAGVAHGSAAGDDELVPLRGGCPGGAQAGAVNFGGHGGGAIQLVSLTSIDVGAAIVADALFDSNGGSGAIGGGGGGGAILLESPLVKLDIAAALLARGGGGASGDQQDSTPADDGSPIAGGVALNSAVNGNGGDGGTVTSGPQVGESVATGDRAGGGGGGVGRIRINTADGTFTQAPTSVIAGRLTTAKLVSR